MIPRTKLPQDDSARCVVYRDKSEYRIAHDSQLYAGCDIVGAGSPKAMEAVLRLMQTPER